MDEFIEDLLSNEVVFEVTLPVLPKRRILEANEDLNPRVSILEADLSFNSDEEERKLSNNKMQDYTSKNGDSDDEYGNINLDKFERDEKSYESPASESEDSERFDRINKNKLKEKHKDDKYLKKKRHYRDDKYSEDIKKDQEEPEIKVDENSVEYWMNLRKKLGINK